LYPAETVNKIEEKSKLDQQWTAEARRRLAQRRGRKPATKAAQIRALWPEIQAAIVEGQSLEIIRQWLEEDAGVLVTTKSLAAYLTRIRRKEQNKPKVRAPEEPLRPTANASPYNPVARSNEPGGRAAPIDPLANLRERMQKPQGFVYPPGPPDESKLI
jgi:hypothetical protein